MLKRIVQYLRCPHCGSMLTERDRTLICANRHSFDIAKHGYVNLIVGPIKHSVDTNEMVSARVNFLAAGHYTPIAAALVCLAKQGASVPGCVLDVGGGTGYYLTKVMDALPDKEGILLDISKFAARRAATAHTRISAIVADAWADLPICTGAASLVLNVFAPRNGPEFHRVIHPKGALLVVTPCRDHLQELIEPLGLLVVDEEKEYRLNRQLDGYFSLLGVERVAASMTLDHRSVAELIDMGPNAWHRESRFLSERLKELPKQCDVTISVSLMVYRPTQ